MLNKNIGKKMFIRRRKMSKRNLKPFQKGYNKDVGSVLTIGTVFMLLILILMFCFIVYGIINAIRM